MVVRRFLNFRAATITPNPETTNKNQSHPNIEEGELQRYVYTNRPGGQPELREDDIIQ